MDRHPHWIKQGRWGSPTAHITYRPGQPGRYECGQCGRQVPQKAEACFEPASVDGMADEGCGTTFDSITTPMDRERAYCERVRPDLKYIVRQWG